MIAYYFTVGLMVFSVLLMTFGTGGAWLVKKRGETSTQGEPIPWSRKAMTLVIGCLFLWLYYAATIGTSSSTFAFVLFIVHATTMVCGLVRGTLNTHDRMYSLPTMIGYLLLSIAMLSAYIYYGVTYL